MKNFFKKLSFVMALAMVLTALAPAVAGADASYIYKRGNDTQKEAVEVYFGDAEEKRDLNVKINSKKTNDGTWKIGNTKIATIDENGVVTPVKNGTTTAKFTAEDGTAVKVKVVVGTRAAGIKVKDNGTAITELAMTVGEEKELKFGAYISKKAKNAGATKSSQDVAFTVEGEAVTTAQDGKYVTVTAAKAGTATLTFTAGKKTATVAVTVVDALAAKQTGASKITVTGSNLSDTVADYVVKRGNTTLTIKSVALNEAKTEAVITSASSSMPKGDYTLSFKGSEAVAFTVETAAVAKITIDPEYAILKAGSTTQAVAYYKVFDQFGDDVTVGGLGQTVQVSGSDNATITSAGTVTFTNGAGYTMNLSQVSVALVCNTNGVNTTKILTVAQESKLASVEYVGVYMNYAGNYVPATLKEGLADLTGYYLFFTGVDQYGLPTSVADSKLQVNLSSITGLTAGGVATATPIRVNNVTYIAIPLSTANALGAGQVTLLSVVLNTGATLQETLTVEAAKKIASLTIIADAPVYGNKVNTLSYEALDTEGNVVTDFASLQVLNSTNYLKQYAESGVGVRFVRNNDGSAKLVYQAASNPNPIAVPTVLTVQTPTMAFSTANISIQPNRVPQAIIGVAANNTLDLSLAATTNGGINVDAKHLVFEDQYGNALYYNEFTGYTVDVKFSGATANMAITTGSAINSADATIFTADVNATTSAAVEVKVTLINTATSKEVTGSDYTFKVYSVNLDDVTNLAVAPIGLKYAGTTFRAVVYGSYAGETVYLSGNEYEVMNGAQNTVVSVPAIANPAPTTLEDTVNVLVKNTAGTIVTAKYSYSNAARTISSVKAKTAFTLGGNVISTTSGVAVTATSFAAVLAVDDQYEDKNNEDASVIAEAPYVTLTNLPANVKAQNNGRLNASVQITTPGYHTIHVKYTWLNGYTFEQDVVINVTN